MVSQGQEAADRREGSFEGEDLEGFSEEVSFGLRPGAIRRNRSDRVGGGVSQGQVAP